MGYCENLEHLIEKSLLDGKVTDDERNELVTKARDLGYDVEDFNFVLDAKIAEYSEQNSGFLNKVVNFGKKIIGRQAYLDYKRAKEIMQCSEKKLADFNKKQDKTLKELNETIDRFGKLRLESLEKTVGKFLSYIEKIGQTYKINAYELTESINIPKKLVYEMQQITMNGREIAKTAITSGTLGVAAVAGIPAAITAGVGTLATASTGAAISSLSGAAATNAIMAWLGGGAIAAGGGGMAAGATVLAVLTWVPTSIIATASAGFITSQVMAKKLTKAVEYQCEVDIKCETIETSCTSMNAIKQRTLELENVTTNLYKRCDEQLTLLLPLSPLNKLSVWNKLHNLIYRFRFLKWIFRIKNFYVPQQSKEFLENLQKTGLLVKSMSELAKTPLFDKSMNLSEDSEQIIVKTKNILNTELL